jgi:hypothetical protein
MMGGTTFIRLWNDIHQPVLGCDTYKRRKSFPLLVGEAVDTAEIIFRTETPALGTKAIYTPDLKRSQTKTEQLGTVSLVGIEREGLRHYLGHCIISG